jgi:hypothetical protein
MSSPSKSNAPDLTKNGERIGRFRDYPLPWEVDKGTPIDRVAEMGRASIAFRKKTGTEAPYSETFDLVHNMGVQVQSLTRAAVMGKPQIEEGKAITEEDIQSFPSDWTAVQTDALQEASKLSSIFSTRAARSRVVSVNTPSEITPIRFNAAKIEEDADSECDSDEDWDTSEWDRLEIQKAVQTLLDQAGDCDSTTALGLKRRKLATGMLIKLVKKHVSALEYLEGGMDRLMDKALRNASQEQTMKTTNMIPVLASLAAVPDVALRICNLNGTIKCIKCLNQALDLAVSLVQSMFRHHQYVTKKSKMFPPAVRARAKAMQLMHIDEIKQKFKEVRKTPTGGDVPDEIAIEYVRLLYNLSRPSRGKQGRKEATMIKRYGGMVALIRCSEYGSEATRSMACKCMRNLVFHDDMRLPLLHAGGAGALSSQLKAKHLQDQYNAMEVFDMCAQRCFASQAELKERPDITEAWRDMCRSCGMRCGRKCQQPEYEAGRLIGSSDVLNTLFRYIDSRDITKRFGALMLLHKLAAGPAVVNVVASACLGRRRSGTLYVRAIAGRGLPNMDDLGAMDPYLRVTLRAPPEKEIVKQTKPVLDGGGDCKWGPEHENIMHLRYDTHGHDSEHAQKYAKEYAIEKKNAEDDPFLDDEIPMVPPGRVRLKLEVMDFDYVGEHDLSGFTEVDITEDIGMSLMRDTRWFQLAREQVVLHMGDTAPKEHVGCYGEGGQVRVEVTFVADGATTTSKPHVSPSHISRERRHRNEKHEKEESRGKLKWKSLSFKWKQKEKKFRPSAQESIIGCILSTEPGEGIAALAIWQNMARFEKTRRQMISSGGALETLLPLLYQSMGTGDQPEVNGYDLLRTMDDPMKRADYIASPIRTTDYVFVRALCALVVLAGDPMKRPAEETDFGMSEAELSDELRRELVEMLSRPKGEGQAVALRLKQIQAIPHLLRFVTGGECCGENELLVETSMGGSLTIDSYVSAAGVNEGEGLMRRRQERRRIGAFIIEQFAAHKEVVPLLSAPFVVIFLVRVIQENWLYRMSGEFNGLDDVSRAMYQVSSRSACRALSYIARDALNQPSARHEVAGALLQLSALRDVTALVGLPVDAKSQGRDRGRGYDLDVEASQAAVELLGSIVPRTNEGVADEQLLEVEAMKAVKLKKPDGIALLIMAKESTPTLANVLQVSGVPRKDGTGVRHPSLLNATLFTLSRISCTNQTASAIQRAGGVKKLTFLVPPPPRLDDSFKQPRLTGGDYRPLGASLQSRDSEDAVLLRMLPPTVFTLLAALGRSREATQDMCAYGFLERCIERFFTLTHHPGVDLKSWGEIALFFARLSRGGKNVKGYGSVNDVLMRCNVAPKLYQMAIPDHGQHRRVRLHAFIALVRMSEDPLLCTPLLMETSVTIGLALDVATNERESDSMRRQALLLLRNVASFPDEKYHPDLNDAGVIDPLQKMGRNFTAEVEERNDGKVVKKVETSAGSANSSVEQMSVPTLGQISRDVLELLGHVMENDETHHKGAHHRIGPFGRPVSEQWLPLYLRDNKAGIEEAEARTKMGIKNIDLYNYDPVHAKQLPLFMMEKVKGGTQFYEDIHQRHLDHSHDAERGIEEEKGEPKVYVSPPPAEKKKKKKKKKKKTAPYVSPAEMYRRRYGKPRSNPGNSGFFACGVYGCNYVGKTYAHLSLHCALSHFCSHYDIPITSTRAFNPTLGESNEKGALARSSVMATPISRWSLPPLEDKMDDTKGSTIRPMLLDPIFTPAADVNSNSPTVGVKERKEERRRRREMERTIRETEARPDMVPVEQIMRIHGHEVTVKMMKKKPPSPKRESIQDLFRKKKKKKKQSPSKSVPTRGNFEETGVRMTLNHRLDSMAVARTVPQPIRISTPPSELGLVFDDTEVGFVSPMKAKKSRRRRG